VVAYHAQPIRPRVYYWAREVKNSNAEVDYIIAKSNRIVSIEIKSGSKGHMNSPHLATSPQ